MKVVMRSLLVAALFAVNVSQGGWFDGLFGGGGPDDVVVLTDANFDDFVKENDKVLVEFYAPWCGHCKKLEPEYKKAAAKPKADGSTTILAKVDATAETRVAKEFGVRGFPTMKYFNGGEASEYGGGRSEDTIVSWIKKRELPAVSEITDQESLDKLTKSATIVVVGYFAKDSDADKTFRKLGDAKRDTFVFGVSNDEAFNGDKNNSVELYREAGEAEDKRKFESVTVSSEDVTEDGIKKFLDAERFPLIDEIGPENYRDYMDRGLPLVWVAIDPSNDDEKNGILAGLKAYTKEFKGKLSFTYVDGIQYEGHISNLGIKKTPGLVIVDNNTNEKFLFEGDVTSADDQKAFFAKYTAGELKAFLKTEDAPEKNDDPVTVVVGSTFKEIVWNPNADVLVEFYAPWCGHCKKLAPEYEKLGEEFKDRDDVVIAKMDSTANDNPSEDISGFPTLVFYPRAGSAEEVEAKKEKYEGARTADGMIKFMKKKIPAAAEKAEEATGTEHDELQEPI